MELLIGADARNLLKVLPNSKTGTEVIWSRSDRLLDLEISTSIDEQLNEKISHANKQLSLIFHRYLAGEVGYKLAI